METAECLTKTCSRCGEEKSVDDFFRRSRSRDGRQAWCKECSTSAAREHEEAKPEMVLERVHRRYYKDVEASRKKQRDYRRTNRGRVNAAERRWRQRHPETVQRKDRKRQYRKRRGDPCDQEAVDWFDVIINDLCSYCGGKLSEEIDHIDAIALGGSNSWDNFTGACKSCNSRKREEPLLQFLLRATDPLGDLPF